MKVCTVIVGVLVACAVSLAAEHGPLLTALQPEPEVREVILLEPVDGEIRQKRSLLLGAGLVGAGLLGAGVLGAGALGAGALGAGILGAKAVGAGVVGGTLAASALHGRSYGYGGGWGYGGGYSGYKSFGYGGYPRSYYVESW